MAGIGILASALRLVRAPCRACLSKRTSGQATTEYMLILAVLVLALVLAFWLVAPGLREGFAQLALRIIAEKP